MKDVVMNHLVDALASTLFAVRLTANVPVDRHAMYQTQPESMRRVFHDEAEAILRDPVFRNVLVNELAAIIDTPFDNPGPLSYNETKRRYAELFVSRLLPEEEG